MKPIKLVLISFTFLFSSSAFAQATLEWSWTFDGAGSYFDEAKAVATDDAGNIYITGYTTNIFASYKYCTAKLTPGGDTLWVRYWDESKVPSDVANTIAVGVNGNVFVGGVSNNSLSLDLAVVKYDSNGNELWAASYPINWSNGLTIKGMVLDEEGNVFITATQIISSVGIITVKFDSNGNMAWKKEFNGPYFTAQSAGVALDASGNVYIAGLSRFDLNIGVELMLMKYSNGGDSLWLRHYYYSDSYEEEAIALAVDHSGNIYLVGHYDSAGGITSSLLALKYDGSGVLQWSRRYSPTPTSYSQSTAATVDVNNNLIIFGQTRTNFFHNNYLIVKYDPAGNFQWAEEFNNSPGNRQAYARAGITDAYNNIYITGQVNDIPDDVGEQYDVTTVKYSPDGSLLWTVTYDGVKKKNDDPASIAVDAYQNVIVAGNADYLDMLALKYSQPTSVGSGATENSFSIYPNPAHNELYIQFSSSFSGEAKFTVKNIIGQQVEGFRSMIEAGENNIQLNMIDMPPGMYLLQMDFSGFMATKKIMVQ